MSKSITVREIEYIAEKLAQELFLINEYGADISSRPADVLENCLSEAFQTFEKKFIYPDLLFRAGIFFYLMIKKRPFECCNKRIAVTTLLTFLFANNKWLMVDPPVLYRFSGWVGDSLPEFKEEVVMATEKFLRKHIVSLQG